MHDSTVRANIVDVAPTILYAMGLPIPPEMDGRVLLEIFSEEYRQAHPLRYEESHTDSKSGLDQAATYSEEEEQEMQRRMRALGYMD